MGIGARLREARVANDISLEELQDTTKIQKRYLVAIEEENFSVLPGKFYAKAFIKEYAIAVGLEPNELMEEFKQDIPSTEEDTTTQYTRIARSRKDNMPTKSNAIFSFIPTLIVVILIIGILFIAWWFFTKSNEQNEETPQTDQTDGGEFYRPENNNANPNPNPDEDDATDEESNEDTNEEEPADDSGNQDENVEEEPELNITVTEQGVPPKPQSELEVTNAGEELNFEFSSTEDVWLDVQNDNGQSFYSAMVKPNQPVELTLTGETRILLNIGNAPGLTVKINDVQLEYPVDPSLRGADHQRLWLNVVESNE